MESPKEDRYKIPDQFLSDDDRVALGVSESPASEQIVDAHRRLIKKYHPDLAGEDEKLKGRNNKIIQRINIARDNLLDKIKNGHRSRSYHVRPNEHKPKEKKPERNGLDFQIMTALTDFNKYSQLISSDLRVKERFQYLLNNNKEVIYNILKTTLDSFLMKNLKDPNFHNLYLGFLMKWYDCGVNIDSIVSLRDFELLLTSESLDRLRKSFI